MLCPATAPPALASKLSLSNWMVGSLYVQVPTIVLAFVVPINVPNTDPSNDDVEPDVTPLRMDEMAEPAVDVADVVDVVAVVVDELVADEGLDAEVPVPVKPVVPKQLLRRAVQISAPARIDFFISVSFLLIIGVYCF